MTRLLLLLRFHLQDFLNLREKCLIVARTGKGDQPNISTVARSDFLVAMAEIGIAHADLSSVQGNNDAEVIDRLFTMFDDTGG